MSYIADHMRQSLANHELTPVQTGVVTAYRMGRPHTRMMSTLILFTPEGIALMGDLTPERHGSISALGYGLDWFAGTLSEDYLCKKFLTTRWVHELAINELRDPRSYLREDITPETGARLDEIAHELADHGCEWVAEQIMDLGFDNVPGFGYDPGEAGWLCAIQQRFAELYGQAEARSPKPIASSD